MLLIKKKDFVELTTDLKESFVTSNLMDDFPPICKENPPEVRAAFVYENWEITGETNKYDDIPDTMYGGTLPIARKKRKSEKKATSEAAEEEEASEPQPKSAKKDKVVVQVNLVGPALPTIQEEVADLKPVKVLETRTRGKKSLGSSGSLPAQPKIRNRKPTVRKLKESKYILQEVEEAKATQLCHTLIFDLKIPSLIP